MTYWVPGISLAQANNAEAHGAIILKAVDTPPPHIFARAPPIPWSLPALYCCCLSSSLACEYDLFVVSASFPAPNILEATFSVYWFVLGTLLYQVGRSLYLSHLIHCQITFNRGFNAPSHSVLSNRFNDPWAIFSGQDIAFCANVRGVLIIHFPACSKNHSSGLWSEK